MDNVMTFEQFANNALNVPNEKKEPFCPFGCWYCNDAYSACCRHCQESHMAYYNYIDKLNG